MNRRDFIKHTACGTAAIAVGSRLAPFFPVEAHAQHGHQHVASTNLIQLGMTLANVEMVDTILVPHWVYTVNDQPTLPGPMIFAFADETFQIQVTNNINDGIIRGFAIVGHNNPDNHAAGDQFALLKQVGNIGFGQSQAVTINAGDLRPGTYIYKDPTLDPISRVFGLHGVLIILPSATATNPYGAFSTPTVTRLFNDLGVGVPYDPDALFPGDPWYATTEANPDYKPSTIPFSSASDNYHYKHFRHLHAPVFEKFYYRTRVWVHSSIDPDQNNAIISGQIPADPATFRSQHVPRYFTINGRQGAYAAHSHDITASGTIGEPHVIRMVNVGLATHSPHFHGNHVYMLAQNNVLGAFTHTAPDGDGIGQILGGGDNLVFVDTLTLAPEDRADMLLPFIRPPDIPRLLDGNGKLLSLRHQIREELNTVLITPQDPLPYPMHCHTEMAQTAAGGNYPQGQVVHWEIIGEFGELFRGKAVGSIVPPLVPLLLGD